MTFLLRIKAIKYRTIDTYEWLDNGNVKVYKGMSWIKSIIYFIKGKDKR